MGAKGAGARNVNGATADVAVVESDAGSWASVCLNCSTPLSGPFCSHCGQRAMPPHPTVRELAGDAYHELVGWDGKVAATLRLLVTRPGELTRVLLEGGRARYIPPVRLYLLCSVLYFLVAATVASPIGQLQFGIGVEFSESQPEMTAGEAAWAKAVVNGLAALSAEERAALDAEMAGAPSLVRPFLVAMAEDYRGLSRRVIETMPRALFVLIPALALILALFHRRRPYPDHLYFAIHLQAFIFLMLAVSAVAQTPGSSPLMVTVQLATALWILIYAVVAQRRVYGGTWLATGLKAIGAAALYGMLWSLTSVLVTFWALRQR
jgi:hypothetical protein